MGGRTDRRYFLPGDGEDYLNEETVIELPCVENKGLPATFLVAFPSGWECRYLLVKNGYFGVPLQTKGRKEARLGHHLCLEKGSNFGRVTPAVTTNLLAREPGERGKVSKDRYLRVIRDVVGAVKTAFCFRDTTDVLVHNVKSRIPKWVTLREGTGISAKEAFRCLLAGVPDHVLEHVEVCGFTPDVDSKRLVTSLFDPRYIEVVQGSWSGYASDQVRIARVPAGIKTLMQQDRLTLRPAVDRSTISTSR